MAVAQWLGYTAAATLMLAVAWVVRGGLGPGAPATPGTASADGRQAALMEEVAAGLLREAPADSLVVVRLRAAQAGLEATAAVGLAAQGSGTRVRVLAVGLPAPQSGAEAGSGYAVEAYLRGGGRRNLGSLRPLSRGRWAMDAVLPEGVGAIEGVAVVRGGRPVMEADVRADGEEP